MIIFSDVNLHSESLWNPKTQKSDQREETRDSE